MSGTKVDIEELRRGGVVALKDDLFSLWVKTACCNQNSAQLRKIADISDKYARGIVLFTTRQIPIIPFIKLTDVSEVKQELAKVDLELDRCGPRVRNLNVCYSPAFCPEAVVNCISLGEKLENFFRSEILHKIKIGVAGCAKDCVVSRALNDIGFVGVGSNGGTDYYDVYIGGRLGVNANVGVKIAGHFNEDACVRFISNYLELLERDGKGGERGADVLKRLGLEKVKEELTRDSNKGEIAPPVTCPDARRQNEAGKIILKIRATCGEVASKQLRKIADISDKFGYGFVHFGVWGAPEIPGVAVNRLSEIDKELSAVGLQRLEKGINNLQACFGNYCAEGLADSQPLLREIEKKVKELDLNNLNIKMSAAGCPNSCGIAHLGDIGFHGVVEPVVDSKTCDGCGLCVHVCKRKAIAIQNNVATIDKTKCRYCGQCRTVCPFDSIGEKRRGFAMLAGGKEGADTRLGTTIAEFLSPEQALRLAESCLRLVKERKANVSTIIDEVGIEKFKQLLTAGAKK